jgi:S1-C subfamily serine protease
MKSLKTIALATALVGAAGAGAAVAPASFAQSTTPRVAVAPQADVFSIGGGGRIGVSIRDVDGSDKTKAAAGVVIESVDEDSPASKAGLKVGDIVTEFDSERVRSVRQFTRLVSETPEGRTVAAVVLRDGQRVTVNVTPESRGNAFRLFRGDRWEPFEQLYRYETIPTPARPSTPAPPAPPRAMPLPAPLERYFFSGGNQLGITANHLEPQLAEYFGTKEGVLVASVSTDSAAAKAGLKAGDVITTFNGSTVRDPNDLRTKIRNLEGGEFTLGIMRDKKPITLKGKLEPPTERRRTTARTIL